MATHKSPGRVRRAYKFIEAHRNAFNINLLDLRQRGEICSRKRFSRTMRENGLRALCGYRIRDTPVAKSLPLVPNLLQRRFTAGVCRRG